MKIAVDEFDGKVVYGAKRQDTGSGNILCDKNFDLKSVFSKFKTLSHPP